MTTRGSGETTRQMLSAPRGAFFVWCNHHMDYPRHLAKLLGRGDLQIKPPSFLRNDLLRGYERELVVDHAAYLTMTSEQFDALKMYRLLQEGRNKV